MNKRLLSKLEQGEGTTLVGKLLLTRMQRQTLLKWLLMALIYLLLQVMQDVIFSRFRILGGCPDVVPGFLMLVCMLQGPVSGGLFTLCCCVFRDLAGAVLGPVTIVVVTGAGVLLSVLRKAYLWRELVPTLACCELGLLLNQAALFAMGLFLAETTPERWVAALGGLLGSTAAMLLLYPVVRAVGQIGGNPWRE